MNKNGPGTLDWSEELQKTDDYRHIPTALWAADQHGGGKQGIDPLNKSEKRIKEGETPYRPTDKEITAAIMHNAPKQPTDEEMFGHLVVSEEQVAKAKADWYNKLQGFYDAAMKPVIPEEEQELEWGSGKSFNSTLSDQERLKRNMYTGE